MAFNPGPNDRYVETSIESLLEMFKDYTNDIPQDAHVISYRFRPDLKGQIEMVIESPSIPADAGTLLVHFDLRRFTPVSGPTKAS